MSVNLKKVLAAVFISAAVLFSVELPAQTAAEIEAAKSVARQMGYSDAEINTMLNNYVNGGKQQSASKAQQSEGRQGQTDVDAQMQAAEGENAEENGDQTDQEVLQHADDMYGAIYGHDIFTRGGSLTPSYNVPTPDRYVLGPDDEIVIDIWGAVFTNIVKKISPEGTVVLDNIGPVYLNGLTIKDAEEVLKKQLSRIYSGLSSDNPDTFMQLSLGRVRSVTVNVFGDVRVPGAHTLPSLSSMLTVVKMAGGVTGIGTVRNIKLYRNGKVVKDFDVYKYFSTEKYGKGNDMRLQDDDVIMVESYESLVSLQGEVKRPMRYEMKKGETLEDLIGFAGGLTARASRDVVHIDRTGTSPVESFDVPFDQISSFVLADGDIVTVKPSRDFMANSITVEGSVWNPGAYAISDRITTAKHLVEAAGGLLSSAYMEKALFFRIDPVTNRTQMMDVSVKGIMDGSEDFVLQNGDALFILSNDDLLPKGYVTVMGEVKNPGDFTYSYDMTIEDALLMAGGENEFATMANVEIARRVKSADGLTSPDSIAKILRFNLVEAPSAIKTKLEPYDMLFIRRTPGYRAQIVVTVNGEVNFPGAHVIEKKVVRISDVIAKTGGFTDEAYLGGARLSRQLTNLEYQRAVLARQMALEKLQTQGDNMDINIAEVTPEDRYNVVIDLKEALENPDSDANIALRSGDIITIPQIDYSVKISGGVQFPNVVAYKKGMKLKDYINMAGGYVQRAKRSGVYVVHMNGAVQAKQGMSSIRIKPGAEIIVPVKQPKREVSIGEVMSIATSTASLATMVVSLVSILTR